MFTVYARYFLQVGFTQLAVDFKLFSIVVVALDVGVSAELW